MFASYALRCSGLSAASSSSVGTNGAPDIAARLDSSPCLIAASFIASLMCFRFLNILLCERLARSPAPGKSARETPLELRDHRLGRRHRADLRAHALGGEPERAVA